MKKLALSVVGFLAATGLGFAAEQAPTATLISASGEVLVSRGEGFAELQPGAALQAGDRVLVKKGVARLALGPNCPTKLGPNSMVMITERDGSLCATRVSADPAVLAQGGPREQVGPGMDVPGAAIVAGFVGVTGVALAVAISNRHSNHNRVSR